VKISALKNGVRNLVRNTGYDIVRHHQLPKGIDAEIAETIRQVRPFTMTSDQRIVALCDAVRYLVDNRIEGDVVECGVWKGGSMMAVARTLLQAGDTGRNLFLFDTFEGMTEPGGDDVSLDGETAAALMQAGTRDETDLVWCYAPLERVKQTIHGVGYEPAKIHFVKGRVEQTIPGQAPDRIALLRLDTDWYESTRHELEHLYPRLVPGGVLIIDDYGHWQGARKAVDEYISKHQLPILLHRIDYSGRCAIKPR